MNILVKSQWKLAPNGLRAYRVVLWRRRHSCHPYVVHYQGDGSCGVHMDNDLWTGSYLTTIKEAAEVFSERCKMHGLKDEYSPEVTYNEL